MAMRRRKRSTADTSYDRTLSALQDDVGKLAMEVGVIETLANAAATVAGHVGDDRVCRRRLLDLACAIESAASEALETADALDVRVRSS